jgi:hypothetical protein
MTDLGYSYTGVFMDNLILSSLSLPKVLGCGSEKLRHSWQQFLDSLQEFGLKPIEIPSQPQHRWQLTFLNSMYGSRNVILGELSFIHQLCVQQ